MSEDRKQEEPVDAAIAAIQSHPATHWLEPIFRAHARSVLQTAFRITGNANDAEDVLQTVFLRLARRADPPDLSTGPLPYLRRAATNAALDVVQSRRTHPVTQLTEVMAQLVAAPQPGADRQQLGRELEDRLRTALASLSRRHAEMFVLKYFEGLDNTTIVRELETSPGTVAVTLHRVRSRLADELGELLGGIQ